MSKTKTIPLTEPIIGHNGPIREIVIRPPTFDEFVEHGEVYFIAETPEGQPFVVENNEVIQRYMQLCVVEPKDQALIRQGGMRLARTLRREIMSFFRDGGAEGEASPTSPTNSSSPSAGAPATSGA